MSTIDRRTFLLAGALAAAGVGLAGCTFPADWVRLEASAVESLRRRIRGTVLVSGDTGFTAAWMPRNGRYADTVPQLAVRVADDRDVATCLSWSAEQGLPIAVRGGGHSYAGLSTTRGLVVDLSKLSDVAVGSDGLMTVGGAATNAGVLEATLGGDWLLPAGTCLSVCVGGLALGGGIGYHSRWAGLTSDRLRSARVVTADGEVVDASADEHPDLFWALRGGTGGSFGVVTEFRFDAARVPRDDIVYYRFAWTGADAAIAVLVELDRIQQSAPAEFVASAGVQATPIGDDGARAAMDVFVRGQFLGSEEDFRAIVAPLLAAAEPSSTDVRVEPFWEVAPRFTNPASENHSWGDISRYADAPLPEAALARVVDLLADAPSRSTTTNVQFWMIGWVGGPVIDSLGRTDTAYVHRGMTSLLRPTPVWANLTDAALVADLEEWTAAAIDVLDPHTPRESYQNFPNRAIEDWEAQYFAENLERLREVKSTWDPRGVFASVQGITPRA
ncbi:FAD-binding oxidoreductase [Agromyces sp. NPDC004153]